MDVLVVEDEWLIAEELKDSLEEMGHIVLGPALNCTQALEILNASKPDVAILDTELGNESCEPVFERCVSQRIPVIISSGHNRSALPAFVVDRILVAKPHAPDALARALAEATAAQTNPIR